MPFLIILFVFLGLHALYSTSKKVVFLVQPFMTYLNNDKKTAECSNPWEISKLPYSVNQCLFGVCGEVKCDSL